MYSFGCKRNHTTKKNAMKKRGFQHGRWEQPSSVAKRAAALNESASLFAWLLTSAVSSAPRDEEEEEEGGEERWKSARKADSMRGPSLCTVAGFIAGRDGLPFIHSFIDPFMHAFIIRSIHVFINHFCHYSFGHS